MIPGIAGLAGKIAAEAPGVPAPATLVGVGSGTTATQSAETMNVAYPAETLAANDVAFLHVTMSGSAAAPYGGDINTPAGWTVVDNSLYGTFRRNVVFWKRLTGSESGSVTVTVSANTASTDILHGQMSVWRGCVASGTPYGDQVTLTAAARLVSGKNYATPSGPDRTLLNFYGRSTATVTPYGGGFTELYDSSTARSNGNAARSMSYKTQTQPEPAGEHLVNSGSAAWSCISLSLIPAVEVSSSTPIAGDPHWANVVLLIGAEGPNSSIAFADERNITRQLATDGYPLVSGQPTISTSVFKAGSSSIRSLGGGTGSGGVVYAADSADWEFGADPWTLECFVQFNALAGNTANYILGQYNSTGNQRSLLLTFNDSTNTLSMVTSADGTATATKAAGSWNPTTGVQYHVVGEWDGTTYRTYVDGVMIGSSTGAVTLHNSTAAFTVCGIFVGGNPAGALNGWIDEVRVTKGVARYASDAGFVVPSTPFPRGA